MQPATDDDSALADEDARVAEIVRQGPRGAFAVAGLATALVVALVLVFYVAVYLPRGAVQ